MRLPSRQSRRRGPPTDEPPGKHSLQSVTTWYLHGRCHTGLASKKTTARANFLEKEYVERFEGDKESTWLAAYAGTGTSDVGVGEAVEGNCTRLSRPCTIMGIQLSVGNALRGDVAGRGPKQADQFQGGTGRPKISANGSVGVVRFCLLTPISCISCLLRPSSCVLPPVTSLVGRPSVGAGRWRAGRNCC
jgi:hypothetical protein